MGRYEFFYLTECVIYINIHIIVIFEISRTQKIDRSYVEALESYCQHIKL